MCKCDCEVGPRSLAYLHTYIRLSLRSVSCLARYAPPPSVPPLLAPLPASCPPANPDTKYRLRLNFGHKYLILITNIANIPRSKIRTNIALEVSHPDKLAYLPRREIRIDMGMQKLVSVRLNIAITAMEAYNATSQATYHEREKPKHTEARAQYT